MGAGAIRSLAEESRLPITVVQEFSEHLPFDDGQFDIAFARAVLHHTSDLRSACREFFRVLKPGGRLVAVREHVISRKKDLPHIPFPPPSASSVRRRERFFSFNLYGCDVAGRLCDRCVLSPLSSVINYAPYTEETLKDAIADRRWALAMRGVLRRALSLPGLWSVASRTLLLG